MIRREISRRAHNSEPEYIHFKIIRSGGGGAGSHDGIPLLGMALVTLSASLHSVLNLSVKQLLSECPWHQIMFIRVSVTWLTTVCWLLLKKQSLFGPRDKRRLRVIRAVYLWGAIFSCF